MKRIIFATSEVDPLIKTGGLADVSAALPAAMIEAGLDVRLILPATASALAQLEHSSVVAELTNVGGAPLVRIHLGTNPGMDLQVYLVEAPGLLDRPGTPYSHNGHDWHDNAERFAVFAHAVVRMCTNNAGLAWRPQLVHCNDWTTGLVPALLSVIPDRPTIVFTIHNIAYQGVYPINGLPRAAFPEWLIASEKVDFHDQFSFMKAGLAFADRITTVSPTYAEEIQSEGFGCGLDGLIRSRRQQLDGIINGIDEKKWNPATDSALSYSYNIESLGTRSRNKHALANELSLQVADAPMIGFVGRLVEPKGIDLILDALATWPQRNMQVVMLGAGDSWYESRLIEAAAQAPGKVAVRIGIDDALARKIYASSDILLIPSRFEPCGLCQLYAQRYGAVPVVHGIGGLADTVTDVTEDTLADGTASGFVFSEYSAASLVECVDRALDGMAHSSWTTIQSTGMSTNFGWRSSVKQYQEVYAAAKAANDRRNEVGD